MNKKYAVVTTIYNDASVIWRFLENIAAQSCKPTEIIIADGGSTDDIEDIINAFRKQIDIPILLLKGKRLNISEGFNSAIRASCEEIVMITSVGNRYNSSCFERLFDKIQEGYDAVYAAIKGSENTRFSILYNCAILGNTKIMKIPSNHGTMIRKSVIEELGFFCENFYYAGEDYEFYQRFKMMNKSSYCIFDEYIIWDVPSTNNEFKKQIKVYTIATMQMHNNFSIMKKLSRRLIEVSAPFAGIALFIGGPISRVFATIITVVWAVYFACLIQKKSLLGCALYFEKKFLEIHCYLTEIRFWDSKNKIDISRRLP